VESSEGNERVSASEARRSDGAICHSFPSRSETKKAGRGFLTRTGDFLCWGFYKYVNKRMAKAHVNNHGPRRCLASYARVSRSYE
jgi:hypothetical protein